MERGRMLFDHDMLQEESGDSEADYPSAAEEAESGAAEDDAESCSSGSLSAYCAVANDYDSRGAGWGVEDEEEDGVVNQCCGGVKVVVPPPAAEKEETSGKLNIINEREAADRLFWEACLAS